MNMSKDYDQITAFHYSVFRPSLHTKILDEYLKGHEKYNFGLDVGSGTGQSSIALANYCKQVIGLEPSKEMLSRSLPHPNVDYAHYDLKEIDFEKNTFDIITFAGSLYYAKSQYLLNDLVRVCNHSAIILIYDFEILLVGVLELLNIRRDSTPKSEYDHQVDFSGLDESKIDIVKRINNQIPIGISVPNLTHLILSFKDIYIQLLELYESQELYHQIARELSSKLDNNEVNVQANTYLTVYRVVK